MDKLKNMRDRVTKACVKRASDDILDAMRYCYMNTAITQDYSHYVEGLYPSGRKNPNRLIDLGLRITKVIFNDPATIVFWSDGTKTVAKCSDEDYYDKTTGLAIAVCKKIMGYRYREIFQEFIPDEDTEEMNNIPYGWPTFFDNIGPFGVTSEEAAKKMNKPLGVTLEEATKNMNQRSKIIIEGSIEIK